MGEEIYPLYDEALMMRINDKLSMRIIGDINNALLCRHGDDVHVTMPMVSIGNV